MKIVGSTSLRSAVFSLALLAALSAGCANPRPIVPDGTTANTGVPACAVPQDHRDWLFEQDGVTFDNRFDGARLNGVERLGPYHYVVTIAPESLPINPSPWYDFKVRARSPHAARIEFRYEHGRQRYWPDLSTDGIHWRHANSSAFAKMADGRYALTVDLGPRALRVAAQPPVTADDYQAWEQRLAAHVGLRTEVIGHSIEGRPLTMLRIGNERAGRVVLVIGRQHPPETTGAQALMKFVRRLADDTRSARQFRAKTLVLVVPLMNPDGVANGNWRGNADCQDINRDWGPFAEPETRAVRDVMKREISAAGRTLVFAVDFHSTWNDVFYTVRDDPARAEGGLLNSWIGAIEAQFPGRAREVANAAKSTVFKNWVYATFDAPAVTYEVGDRTSDTQLDELAGFAADRLMSLVDAQRSPAGK